MSGNTRILIVEDDPMNMEMVADLLDAAGYEVLRAETGEAALALARAAPPDLVLMDIALPGMDGLDAMRWLRQDPRTARIPIVAFTASVMGIDHEKASQAGCLGIIAKPIDTRTFARTIASYLGSGSADHRP